MLIFICAISLLAAFIQGLSGFGFGMALIPALSLFINIKMAIPLAAMSGMLLLLVISWELGKELDFKISLPIFMSSVAGVPFGVWFLKFGDDQALSLALGLFLIGYTLYSMFIKEIRYMTPGWAAYPVGFASGALSGAFSTGGPPVIIYFAINGYEGVRFKGILTAYFLMNAVVMNASFAVTGVITTEIVRLFLYCAPFVAIGAYLGARFYHKLNQKLFKHIVYTLIFIAGVLLIIN